VQLKSVPVSRQVASLRDARRQQESRISVLHDFLTANTQEIMVRIRAKAATRKTPALAETELMHRVPLFLSQLIDRLRLAAIDGGAIEESATMEGAELLAMGFTLSEVVHAYGDARQVITQLADEMEAPITAAEFHAFHRCLDDAIANVVTECERRRDELVAHAAAERLGALAHELRNRLSAAMLAYTILRDGTVPVRGSVGAVLGRSLQALRDLVNNALADVRADSGIRRRNRVSVSEIVRDAEVEAAIGADAGAHELTVSAVPHGIEVEADPQILSAAISNLLHNAFKFSRAHAHIALRTTATADHVLIEVEDECGGLPPGKAEDLFHPFEQRGANRSGLGLGLSVSRKGVEAMGGKISLRDLPGKGCVFCIELPRMSAA
jgi:hypothetical protein